MPIEHHPADELLTIDEAARYLRVPINTLRWYRAEAIGPCSFKLGRRVRYWKSDLDAWLAEQTAKGRERHVDRGA